MSPSSLGRKGCMFIPLLRWRDYLVIGISVKFLDHTRSVIYRRRLSCDDHMENYVFMSNYKYTIWSFDRGIDHYFLPTVIIYIPINYMDDSLNICRLFKMWFRCRFKNACQNTHAGKDSRIRILIIKGYIIAEQMLTVVFSCCVYSVGGIEPNATCLGVKTIFL